VEALRHPVARIRANPWLAVVFAAAALLIVAWLGWAIYIASDRGMNEGLGVLIAVPALLIALAIVSLPFIGGYLLVKRLSSGSDEGPAPAAEQAPDDEESEDTEEKGPADSEASQDDTDEGDKDEEEKAEDDAGDQSEPEPETAAS